MIEHFNKVFVENPPHLLEQFAKVAKSVGAVVAFTISSTISNSLLNWSLKVECEL
jgi:hypothetical protein